jgi:hypothetical protein
MPASLRIVAQPSCSTHQAEQNSDPTLVLDQIANHSIAVPQCAPNAFAPIPLNAEESTVMRAILRSGDPRAGEVAALMQRQLDETSGPLDQEARARITVFYRALLEQRAADPAALAAFLSSAASRVLNRLQLTLVSTAIPGMAPLATVGQMAHSLYQRNWSSVAAALPSLATLLPSLRHWDEVEQLIQSLPADIRGGIEALHSWIECTDEALMPQLDIRQAGPALAVAVLLWQVQKALPEPSQALQGVGRFVAGLPGYWQTLVGMNSVGGSLLAHVVKPDGPDLSADKVRPTPEQKKALVEHQKAVDRGHAVVPEWQVTGAEHADWTVPGQPHRGSAIAAPPAAVGAQQQHDAATSPASRAGFFAPLLAFLPLLHRAGDFVQVPQGPPSVEMQLMGESALHEVLPTQPLIEPPPMLATAGSAGAMRGFASRHPRTMAAAVATGVAAAAGGVVALAWYLWGRKTDAPTLEALVDLAAMRIEKAPDGAWRSELDRLEHALDTDLAVESAPDDASRSGRVRRDAAQSTSTAAPSTAPSLHEQIPVMRLWSLAVARDIAQQPGWEWVAQAPASEQELLVTHWHALRQEQAKLVELDTIPGAALTAALQAHGWTAGWDDIEVRLPSTRAAGVTVDDRLPLLEYCLARGANADATFLRGNVPLSGPELHALSRFVASEGCKGLRAEVDARVEILRPALEASVKATLVIHALRAKAQGTLGGGGEHLAGADIVLGFLQGTPEVTSSPLTYVDRLADGSEVRIAVPNYLVLRSDRNHQVVLYRSDLSTFQAFKDEGGFRQFLDTRRAKAGMFVDHQRVDQTLAHDIVHATAPHQQAAVRERVQAWEPRLTLFQTRPQHPDAWNPQDSFVLDFAASPTGLQDWASRLVHYRQDLEQQRLDQGELRWSPLGIANTAAEATFQHSLDEDLQSLDRHAKPAVTDAMKLALRMAGYAHSLEGFDPDTILLRQGGREMSLTAWATTGWQAGALHRPLLTIDPDVPGHLPDIRPEPDPWPSSEDLGAMSFQLRPAGSGAVRGADAPWTGLLRDEDALRALCGVLEDFSGSNRLAAEYKEHLNALLGRSHRDDSRAGTRIVTATGNQIRLRTRWMIEKAYNDGAIDTATHAALVRAHANIDPASGRPSSLQGVTLAGKPITGLWAMQAGSTTYVYLPDTETGDRLLSAEAFKAWLEENTDGRAAYILARTLYRHHDAVNTAFDRTTTAAGIPLGFTTTRGPDDAARGLIEGRIKDVNEVTRTPLEQVADSLKVIGAIAVAAVCSAATGGTAAALCVAGSLALVAEGIRKGVDLLERGDVDGAIEAMGESVLDATDVLQITAIPALLFRLGRRTLSSVEDAVGALAHWRAQGRGFAGDGVVNSAFQRSRETLSGGPMQVRHAAGGGVVYQQGDAHYIRQGDHFVEVYDDGDGTLRLRDPSRSDAVGAPVNYKDGAWRRSDTAPLTRAPTTPHTRPGSPDWAKQLNAENLPATRYDELEALFGALTLKKPTADVHAVIDSELMNLRISDILADPQTLGLPGDEAMTMRAWADSALGGGKGVLTYTIDGDEWNQVARFGKGDVGLHVRVGSSRDLPTLEDLIAAADQEAVLRRLGLPADTDDASLLAAVREELVRTIRNNPRQSLESWQRWLTMRHRLPTAADNLVKHFRALTKAEAEELVSAASPQLKHQLESWDFPTEIRTAVSNVLASRAQRQQRQAIIEGNVHTLAEVSELSIHLKAVLPGRQVRALSVEGDRIELVFASSVAGAPEAKLSFTARANVDSRPTDGAGKEYATWQEGIFAQLTPAERESLPGRNGLNPTPADLRRAVVDKMRKSPIAAVCSWPRSPGSKFRKADDCSGESTDALAPAAVTSHDREMRDTLTKVMDTTHAKLTERHTHFSRELVEFNSLTKQEADLRQLKNAHGKGQRLDEPANEMDPVSKARLKELQGRSFGDLDSFDIGNFASYELKHLTYDGKQLELPSGFPLVATAMSGNSRPLLGTEGVLEGAPVRRILVPDTEANTILQLFEQYRGDYALGSDLSPVTGKLAEDGQASKLIILKDEDLRVTRPSTKQGKKVKVPVSELTDEEITQLGNADYSPNLRKLVGDAGLLPANVRTWKAGVGYRMYQIRSCSEGKFLDGFFRALGEALPALTPVLWGPRGATVEKLNGNLHMVSEMNPCKRSCDRRLSEMLVMMPGMHIRVFYRFEDNLERVSWWTARKVDVIVTKSRDAWEAAGATWEQMQDMAAIELKKIEAAVRKGTRTWVDEALAQRPPTPPAPKLWEPQIEEAY